MLTIFLPAHRKRRGSSICGIIYCRSILDMHFMNTDKIHQQLLHLLIGDPNFGHVAFVTTFWPPVIDSIYPTRETELEVANAERCRHLF